jgi:putative CocE/NonD family hydrolase
MGRNEWQDQSDWPIPGTQFVKYYLGSNGRANSLFGDGKLRLQPSPAVRTSAPADHFTYNPLDPVPFIMESTYAQLGGPDDYRPVERRDDVLVYTTDFLEEARVICGPVRAHLSVASTALDTDFMVKLIDVWPNGFAQRLTDGMVRARYRDGGGKPSLIEPGKIYGIDVDAWNTCQEFSKGHRLRVEVASSAFPKYDRNQNTGEALGKTYWVWSWNCEEKLSRQSNRFGRVPVAETQHETSGNAERSWPGFQRRITYVRSQNETTATTVP